MLAKLERIERRIINSATEKLNLPVSSVAILLHEGELMNSRENIQARHDLFPEQIIWGNILLIQRADDDSIALVAGHVEPGENPVDAVVRETLEEVNLQISPENLVQVGSFPKVKGFGLVDRQVFTYQLPIGSLVNLGADWKSVGANVYINDPSIGGDIGFWCSVSEPITPNPEVKRLILIHESSLGLIRNVSHFGGHIDFCWADKNTTSEFFKWEITKKLHSALPVPNAWY